MNTEFDIKQSLDGKSIIFTDTTSYSESELESIVETKLHIKTPDGVKYTIFSTYHPRQGAWEIQASSLKSSSTTIVEPPENEIENNCGCSGVISPIGSLIPFHYLYEYANNSGCEQIEPIARFGDGCYEFIYEVYSVGSVKDVLCVYSVDFVLPENASFYVGINGGYTDMTSALSLNNGNAIFEQNCYIDQYENWQIRRNNIVIEEGVFEVTGCRQVSSESEYLYPRLSGTSTYKIPLYSSTRRKLIEKSYLVYKDKAFVSDSLINKAIDSFLIAHSKLEMAIASPPCDCECIAQTVKSVSLLLDTIKEYEDDY